MCSPHACLEQHLLGATCRALRSASRAWFHACPPSHLETEHQGSKLRPSSDRLVVGPAWGALQSHYCHRGDKHSVGAGPGTAGEGGG